MSIFYLFDILGTSAFAISGALFSMNKKMDPFGVLIIAFVTAVGGGTLRDVLIDRNPISWMSDLNYVYVILISVVVAIILRNKIKYLSKSLFLFDTIGLGIFTITGTEIGINHDLHPIICVALGMMSATFGGVIRDTLCNEIPLIFHKEIYAIPCILGSIAFLILSHLNFNVQLTYIFTVAIVISTRLIAVIFKLQLPIFYAKK